MTAPNSPTNDPDAMGQQPLEVLPGGHLRISDGDRELVTTVLTTAYAEGRITREEFDERSTAVLMAKTFNDLAPVTADLMPSAPVKEYSSPLPSPRPADVDALVVVDPAHQSPDTDNLFGLLGTARRSAPGWRMHRKTSVLVGLGDAIIDLTQGVMESPHVEIEVMIGLGDLKLIVPAGVQVIDRVTNILGDSKVMGTRPKPGEGPTITITGVVVLGDIKVMGPDHTSFAKTLRKAHRRAMRHH